MPVVEAEMVDAATSGDVAQNQLSSNLEAHNLMDQILVSDQLMARLVA